MNTFEELNSVFCRVFDDDGIRITPETTANDIDGWDSLSHINLVVAVERHFKVKFKSSEILKWKNVGQMHESLLAAMQAK